MAELVTETVQNGIEQGIITKLDPHIAVACLFGALNFNSLQWLIAEKSFSLEQAAKKVVDVLVKGLRIR